MAAEGTRWCPPSFSRGTDAALSHRHPDALPDDINKKTDL